MEESATSPQNKRARLEPDKILGSRLYNLRDAQNGIDIAFELTPRRHGAETVMIPAHKLVLVAMSEYLETMMTARWAPGELVTIPVPPKVGADAVEVLVKYFYTENLNPDLDTAVLLEVLFLADHYLVPELRQRCDDLLVDTVNVDNCVDIYQYCRLLDKLQTSDRAYNCLIENVHLVFSSPGCLNWETRTWKDILSLNYLKTVTELGLFQNLIEWKDFDPDERSVKLPELLKLVRFQLIGAEDFAKFVVPTGVLCDKTMVDIFVDYAMNGEKLGSEPRNKLEPQSSCELSLHLRKIMDGDRIQLSEGVYEGPCAHSKLIQNIRVEGAGETKSICTTMIILGSGWTISNIGFKNLQIFGDNNNVNEVSVENNPEIQGQMIRAESSGILVQGNDNYLSNVNITKCSPCITVTGDMNTIEGCNLTSSELGCVVNGDKNYVNSTHFEHVNRGVVIDGNRNRVKAMQYKVDDTDANFEGTCIGVYIKRGKRNEVTRVKCSVETDKQDLEDVDFFTLRSIELGSASFSTKVMECGPGKWIIAAKEHKNPWEHAMRVSGEGQVLESCFADVLVKQNLKHDRDVKLVNCIFSEIDVNNF